MADPALVHPGYRPRRPFIGDSILVEALNPPPIIVNKRKISHPPLPDHPPPTPPNGPSKSQFPPTTSPSSRALHHQLLDTSCKQGKSNMREVISINGKRPPIKSRLPLVRRVRSSPLVLRAVSCLATASVLTMYPYSRPGWLPNSQLVLGGTFPVDILSVVRRQWAASKERSLHPTLHPPLPSSTVYDALTMRWSSHRLTCLDL